MTQWVQVLLLVAAMVGLVTSALACGFLRSGQRARRRSTPAGFLPPVTIFKPLKGVDEDLEANLRSFFVLDYPRYELVFGVTDANDPAVAVLRRVRSDYPKTASRLVIDRRRVGHNPKVNNLHNMSRVARYDYWVISDSNVRVGTDYLTDLMRPMQSPDVGLVTSVIRGVDGRSIGARLENLHLNTCIVGAAVVLNRLSNIVVSIGKSMLVRRETIEELGGFGALADYLLEDALLGRRIRALGYNTKITVAPVMNVNSEFGPRRFIERHFRWAVGRFQFAPGPYLAEVFANSIFLSVMAVLVAPSVAISLAAAAISLTKVMLDAVLCRTHGGDVGLSSLWLIPLKDLAIGLIWLAPLITNQVNWRGNIIRVGRDSRAALIRPASLHSQLSLWDPIPGATFGTAIMVLQDIVRLRAVRGVLSTGGIR